MSRTADHNHRESYRVWELVAFASVPVYRPDIDDFVADQLRRFVKKWTHVNLSMCGVSFPSKWIYKVDEIIAVYIRPLKGQAITALAKVLRVDTEDDRVTVSAQFLRLTPDNERYLSSLVLDCQREECVNRKRLSLECRQEL